MLLAGYLDVNTRVLPASRLRCDMLVARSHFVLLRGVCSDETGWRCRRAFPRL